MRRLLAVVLLLGLAGTAYAVNTSNVFTPSPKPDPIQYEGGTRQAGDDIATATPIGGLPFSDAGTTAGYINDYDWICPYSGSTSPDVVYSYAPTAAGTITIDLCASTYDTKVYVVDGAWPSVIACNDDYGCGYSGWQSKLDNVAVDAGHTYYIIVDGYGGMSGSYSISVTIGAGPCVVECPAGALLENEPDCGPDYYDNTNGGCNSTPNVFGLICPPHGSSTAVLCGKSGTYSYFGLSYRDTDWFIVYGLAAGGNMTMDCIAEFPLQLIFIYGPNCANLQYQYTTAAECQVASITWYVAPSAVAWAWVGPSVFAGEPCGQDYVLTITGCSQGPLCPPTPTENTSWGAIKSLYK